MVLCKQTVRFCEEKTEKNPKVLSVLADNLSREQDSRGLASS